jgi:tyrosine-protein phosphatase SIW14
LVLLVPTKVRFALLYLICALCVAQTPGLRNFSKVDDHVYRGAQPAVWGYKTLASMGVKTVIDLRSEGIPEALEDKLVMKYGMNFISVPLDSHKPPSDDQITKILAMLNDNKKWPVYVHCGLGGDRTGTVIACYRIAHDKWDNKKALEEAKSFKMDPGQKLMQEFILHFHLSTVTLKP